MAYKQGPNDWTENDEEYNDQWDHWEEQPSGDYAYIGNWEAYGKEKEKAGTQWPQEAKGDKMRMKGQWNKNGSKDSWQNDSETPGPTKEERMAAIEANLDGPPEKSDPENNEGHPREQEWTIDWEEFEKLSASGKAGRVNTDHFPCGADNSTEPEWDNALWDRNWRAPN